jgi:hypothetical protein
MRYESLERREVLTGPELSVFAAANVLEGGMVVVEISASTMSEDPFSVGYAIEGLTATPTDDYYLGGAPAGTFSGTASFAACEMTSWFEILIVDDALLEGGETLKIVLSNPVNATLSANDEAIVEIVASDPNAAPQASDFLDEYRWVEDDTELVTALGMHFTDADHALSEMSWNVTTSGAATIANAWVDASQNLHVEYITGVAGKANVKVRATDQLGAFAEADFDIWSIAVTSVDHAYQDENEQWVTPSAGDPLWDDHLVKWTAQYNPSNMPGVDSIEMLKMTWSAWEAMGEQTNPQSPLDGWTSFAVGSIVAPGVGEALGNPGGGEVWAIAAKVNFAGSQFALFQAGDETPVFKIDHVEWEGIEVAGSTNLFDQGLFGDTKFFPEKNAYDADDADTHSDVLFKVFVQPAELGRKVYVKAFDPDDPSASMGPVDDDGAGGLAEDNRGGKPSLVTDGKLITTDEIAGAFAVAKTTFKPKNAIGDNYRIVAAPRSTNFDNIEAIYSASPAHTLGLLQYEDGPGRSPTFTILEGGPQGIPGNTIFLSPLLTVWRTLWVEIDTMEDPPNVAARQGDNLESIPAPDIGAFTDAFSAMFIDVQALPAAINSHSTFTFMHHGSKADWAAKIVGANKARDTQTESDHFWTVYLASVYEIGQIGDSFSKDNDDADDTNDDDAEDNEFAMLGWTEDDGPDYSLIAQEVVRDLIAEHATEWNPTEAGLVHQVVALHEIGHQFLGTGPDGFAHIGPFLNHVMAPPSLDTQEPQIPSMQLVFSPVHIDFIRDEFQSGSHP